MWPKEISKYPDKQRGSYPVHMEYVTEWRDSLETIENTNIFVRNYFTYIVHLLHKSHSDLHVFKFCTQLYIV